MPPVSEASSAPGFLARFRPTSPWRLGPDSGARDRVDLVCHSDTLYSAVCSAMLRLGRLTEWLEATAGPGLEVRFSSCFPFIDDALYVTPPQNIWPPPASSRVRWKAARFVPLSVVEGLLAGKPVDENRWVVDGVSETLVPGGPRRSSRGPFRVSTYSGAAVDRVMPGRVDVHGTTCLEFTDGAGLWFAVAFENDAARERWSAALRGALRWLADSGIGGERSRGWGRSAPPEIVEGMLPDLILPRAPAAVPNPDEPAEHPETAWWLLSLFAPGEGDSIRWERGSYSLVTRGGRVDSPVRAGDEKRLLRMVAEGSVLFADAPPVGSARDVAPADFPHPVYRAGYAVAIPIPWRGAP